MSAGYPEADRIVVHLGASSRKKDPAALRIVREQALRPTILGTLLTGRSYWPFVASSVGLVIWA